MANRKSLTVQSLLFSKNRFTSTQAKTWARRHGFAHIDVDEKPNTLRIRQIDPAVMQPKSFVIVGFGLSGIQAVLAKRK
jgi:hypothetical protein